MARDNRQRDIESTMTELRGWLEDCKRGYEAGRQEAFWDAVLICFCSAWRGEVQAPKWLREALGKYARDRADGLPQAKTRKKGRPPNFLRDIHVFESVEHYRAHKRVATRRGKVRRFSLDAAFEAVRRELAEEGINLNASSVRAAYEHGKKLFPNRFSHYIGPDRDLIS